MRESLLLAMASLGMMAQTDPLDGTKWKLASEQDKATIQFVEGRFGIRGCNSMSGAYRIEGAKIVAPQAVSTMMACLPDRQELDSALSMAITKNEGFRVEGDSLFLKSAEGELRFTRELMASKDAATKFIYVAAEMKDCTGVAPMKCLQIRESKDEPWRLHYGGIIGFEPQPGIEYRLRIKEDRIAKPAADQSRIRWFLDLVVEQKIVDPAAVR